ncbi:MAG TPA: tetratricopeptide repeat protein [Kofleriaceae bacterium]|jgi:outer membrane protein assembly factor BamD (BamD/ComL family)
MRRLIVTLALAACAPATRPMPVVPSAPPEAPARDLAVAKPSQAGSADAGARDPRVVDLDIIRITATQQGVGGEISTETVSTAELFRQAGEAVKAHDTERAIGLYRKIASDFPDSSYAPISLFDIAAILDGRGDLEGTIATLRELVTKYPHSRESIDGHLYIAALQADHAQWTDAIATLDAILARTDLTYADRIEALARAGYVRIEQHRYDDAELVLDQAMTEYKQAPRIDDPYYIAMASYYLGEVAHHRFIEAPVGLPDDTLIADLEQKRVLAGKAYDRWKESLGFHQAYWATAAGYQMSQIFVELWEATVKAPYPARIDAATRPKYIADVHERVREHLAKALEGHRMNVELAKAYGVDTTWSEGSAKRASEVSDMLAKDTAGQFVTPD